MATKKRSFLLTGDITHAGRVKVMAKDVDEAIKKAERGEFEVYEEHCNNLSFSFDGNPEDHVEEEFGHEATDEELKSR